jgi:hypothetical protein
MNKRYRFFALAFLCCFCFFGNSFFAKAQVDTGDVITTDDEEFSMDGVEEADDTVIKKYCNNKINNLNPTTLIGLSYDIISPYVFTTSNTEDDDVEYDYSSRVKLNHGIRLDTNFPLISKSNLILNATFSYWESRYQFDAVDSRQPLASSLSEHPLRTATLGILAFKPLDEKHFLIFQLATSLNGNYNFSDIQPDFSKMKYSASLLYGWKYSDDQNFAIGITRTYRGGRLLHVPIIMWNKTFSPQWGMELLLPARGTLRYNFTPKSSLNFGYELEGQSYLMQNADNGPDFFATNNYELSKSEIRPRIEINQAITSFIRLNLQLGVRAAYRFDLAPDTTSDPVNVNDIGVPGYFRIGLNFVSP